MLTLNNPNTTETKASTYRNGRGVTGRMRSDHSSEVYYTANRNYGGNGGRSVIMAAMAAAQLN